MKTMRLTYLTFLFAFWSLLFNCNNTKLKEPELQKAAKQAEIKEIFNLVQPNNKPEEPLYTTLYNGYSISLQSNSSHQELIFKKGNVEVKKTLKFYHENPEIVFHLYKSDLDNIVILIEGRDYYGSNLGIYYIGNGTNKIIEIDDSLNYTQDNPETKGFKVPKAEIIKKENELKCKVYLENKLLSDKTYDISTIEEKNAVSINKYLNNNQYLIKTFDINKDGFPDKIISSKPYEGEDLFIFLGDNNSNYKFVLKTTNFSQDGGNQISDIKQTKDGFVLVTAFPDRGDSRSNYYISSNNGSFILKKIEQESYSWQNGYTETCIQNFNFDLKNTVESLSNIIAKTKSDCTKKFDKKK